MCRAVLQVVLSVVRRWGVSVLRVVLGVRVCIARACVLLRVRIRVSISMII